MHLHSASQNSSFCLAKNPSCSRIREPSAHSAFPAMPIRPRVSGELQPFPLLSFTVCQLSCGIAMPVSYRGCCHCGAARFTFELPTPLEELEVVNCNCTLTTERSPAKIQRSMLMASPGSICTKNGYLMVYPKASELKNEHSEDVVLVR